MFTCNVLALASLLVSVNALRVCHHNDFHARYTEINQFNSRCSPDDSTEDKCVGSSARIQSAMNRASCDIRVFAGDFVQGSVYDSIFGTDIAVDIYNIINYDFVVFGNHEFNKGPDPVYETVLNTPNITWLASNIDFLDAPEGFKTCKFTEQHDICWVSALTQSTLQISSPGPNVTISEPMTALIESIAMCNKTDNVVAITHIGYEQDIELCKNISSLDLVIGGHSHTDLAQGMYPTKVEREDGSICWVVTAFAFGRYLGALDIKFDDGAINFDGYAYTPLDFRVPMDLDVKNLVETYTERLEDSIKTVVGSSTTPIDGSRKTCRSAECQMGNLICDALLERAGPKQGAIACILNGGGIRASFDAGDITVEDVLTVLPFANVHAVITLPGSGILKALEIGFLAISDPEITGRFPQVGGMIVDVDYSAPDGEKVKKVTIAGEELLVDKIYTIVVNDFMARGGDGYMWEGATEIELSGIAVDTLLQDYLGENSPYTPFIEGRINNIAA